MTVQTNLSKLAKLSEFDRWRVLNSASVELKKANTSAKVMQVIANSLNQMGFYILIAQLTQAKTNLTVKEFSPSMPELNGLHNQLIPIKSIKRYTKLIKNGTAEFKTHTLETFQKLLPPPFEIILPFLKQFNQQKISYVVAPIQTNKNTTYLLFAISPHIIKDDLHIITAFTNMASAILKNINLVDDAEYQKNIAQTLQDVSKIVNSSLDQNIVLGSILKQLAKVIPYDSAAILLENNGILKLEAGHGFKTLESVLKITVPTQANALYKELKQYQQPIIINNVKQDKRYTFWAGTDDVCSWIGIPLIWQNKIIGQISIDSFTPNSFTPLQANLVFSFAQHVVIAIKNAQLFNQTTQTTNELRALLDCIKDIASTLDTKKVIKSTVKRIKNLMQATSVTVDLLEADTKQLLPVVGIGATNQPIHVALAPKIIAQAIENKQGVIANNHKPISINTTSITSQSQALMTAPFVVQDKIIGVLTVARPKETPFEQTDLDLLTRFSLQTGIAIENSRLYEQVERRLEREELINNLLNNLNNKRDPALVAHDIMRTAHTIAQADAAALVLLPLNNKEKALQFVYNLSNKTHPSIIKTYPGLVNQVVLEQKILLTHNLAEEIYAFPRWINEDVKGAIAVPLTTSNELFGVLGLFTFNQRFNHSYEILNTLETIGNQAGVAIENALLFQQINDYASTLAEKVEQRTAEIQKQKDQIEAILAGAADAILITNIDGDIEYVNPAFTELTGYHLNEIIGKRPNILKSNQTHQGQFRQMWTTILKGKVWRGTLKNKRKNKTFYDADLTIAPVFSQNNKIEKFVAIQRDVSKATELDRLKTDFLVTAAHELRSPLTSIRGYAELLMVRNEFTPDEIKRYSGYIHEQSVHLTSLVSDLLDISKIEAGAAFIIATKLINPEEIFKRCIAKWRNKTNIHKIQLIEPKEWLELEIDEERLEQALDNLLSNAVKYSPKGGLITVNIQLSSANLRINVSDQGIGLTVEEQKHIFEKFWRADASTSAIEGTGLGMVIVKHIIESHGGKVWVTSIKDVGTTISFTLPLVAGIETILIIEDEPSILEVQERLLILEGYQVLTAVTGLEGLNVALAEHPDLIILDLMLPEIDGEDVLRQLKKTLSTKEIPVVVVSAKSALTQIERTFELGATDFITKPFDIDEYLGRIKKALLK